MLNYPTVVRGLGHDEGGGYVAEVPDLPGCIADGNSPEEAIANVAEAIEEWISAAKELGRPIPQPSSLDKYSGKWVQRVPRSLHMKLALEAEREGVSLNTLATSLIAEGLGKKLIAA